MKNNKGFTLVELLAVIVILALLVVVVATKGFGAFDNTKKSIVKQNEKTIKEAVKLLMVEVQYCDDELDKELLTSLRYNNCKSLQDKAEEGLTITLEYLWNKKYVTNSGVEDILKEYPNYKVKTKLNNDEIVIDMPDEDELENFK